MLDRLRRWLTPPMNRGTITFLADGTVIFGIPEGLNMSQAALAEFTRAVERWKDHPTRQLVIGWPVDVIDFRGLGEG